MKRHATLGDYAYRLAILSICASSSFSPSWGGAVFRASGPHTTSGNLTKATHTHPPTPTHALIQTPADLPAACSWIVLAAAQHPAALASSGWLTILTTVERAHPSCFLLAHHWSAGRDHRRSFPASEFSARIARCRLAFTGQVSAATASGGLLLPFGFEKTKVGMYAIIEYLTCR